MKYENNRQELARRLVNRDIICCVSSLVSTMSALMQACPWETLRDECISWEDDILPLLESYDKEQAGTDYINDCDDFDDLERMADLNGYWQDACAETGFDSDQEYANGDGDMGLIDFAEWFEAHCTDDEKDHALEKLRDYIIRQTDDWDEFCEEFDVDYREDEYRWEVYEHWVVSDWLAGQLDRRGEITGDLCGLTIWGRCGTGQSIALDHVIQEIAMEEWPEDVLKPEPSAEGEGEEA